MCRMGSSAGMCGTQRRFCLQRRTMRPRSPKQCRRFVCVATGYLCASAAGTTVDTHRTRGRLLHRIKHRSSFHPAVWMCVLQSYSTNMTTKSFCACLSIRILEAAEQTQHFHQTPQGAESRSVKPQRRRRRRSARLDGMDGFTTYSCNSELYERDSNQKSPPPHSALYCCRGVMTNSATCCSLRSKHIRTPVMERNTQRFIHVRTFVLEKLLSYCEMFQG